MFEKAAGVSPCVTFHCKNAEQAQKAAEAINRFAAIEQKGFDPLSEEFKGLKNPLKGENQVFVWAVFKDHSLMLARKTSERVKIKAEEGYKTSVNGPVLVGGTDIVVPGSSGFFIDTMYCRFATKRLDKIKHFVNEVIEERKKGETPEIRVARFRERDIFPDYAPVEANKICNMVTINFTKYGRTCDDVVKEMVKQVGTQADHITFTNWIDPATKEGDPDRQKVVCDLLGLEMSTPA